MKVALPPLTSQTMEPKWNGGDTGLAEMLIFSPSPLPFLRAIERERSPCWKGLTGKDILATSIRLNSFATLPARPFMSVTNTSTSSSPSTATRSTSMFRKSGSKRTPIVSRPSSGRALVMVRPSPKAILPLISGFSASISLLVFSSSSGKSSLENFLATSVSARMSWRSPRICNFATPSFSATPLAFKTAAISSMRRLKPDWHP